MFQMHIAPHVKRHSQIVGALNKWIVSFLISIIPTHSLFAFMSSSLKSAKRTTHSPIHNWLIKSAAAGLVNFLIIPFPNNNHSSKLLRERLIQCLVGIQFSNGVH